MKIKKIDLEKMVNEIKDNEECRQFIKEFTLDHLDRAKSILLVYVNKDDEVAFNQVGLNGIEAIGIIEVAKNLIYEQI